MKRMKSIFMRLLRKEKKVMPKSFLLVTPFEGELIIEAESDSSTELYRKMDLDSMQRVVSREEYEQTNLQELIL